MDQLGTELKKVLKAGMGAVAAGLEMGQDAIEQLAKKGEPLYEQAKNAVTDAAGDYRKHSQKPVLLASMDIRRYVRRLIEGKHYNLMVLSYQELTPEISVQPLSRIRL